jgi:hypothetical protein
MPTERHKKLSSLRKVRMSETLLPVAAVRSTLTSFAAVSLPRITGALKLPTSAESGMIRVAMVAYRDC